MSKTELLIYSPKPTPPTVCCHLSRWQSSVSSFLIQKPGVIPDYSFSSRTSHPSSHRNLLGSIFKYTRNLTSLIMSTAVAQVQAAFGSCLDGCNSLLAGPSASNLVPLQPIINMVITVILLHFNQTRSLLCSKFFHG